MQIYSQFFNLFPCDLRGLQFEQAKGILSLSSFKLRSEELYQAIFGAKVGQWSDGHHLPGKSEGVHRIAISLCHLTAQVTSIFRATKLP
jgi:hypothetical protein